MLNFKCGIEVENAGAAFRVQSCFACVLLSRPKPSPETAHSPNGDESILRNLASKLKLRGAGRIVLAVRVR
jgi:hypothetical protein